MNIPLVDNSREIITKRLLNFPRSLVYSAWSDPHHLKNWWGPNGFTNTFELFDFRPGGRWRFVMHGPDKGNYNNECEFLHIDEPRVIYWKRYSNPLFRVAVLFEEVSFQSTNVTFRMIFDTPEECEKLKKFVINKNEENFDRLESELKLMNNTKERA